MNDNVLLALARKRTKQVENNLAVVENTLSETIDSIPLLSGESTVGDDVFGKNTAEYKPQSIKVFGKASFDRPEGNQLLPYPYTGGTMSYDTFYIVDDGNGDLSLLGDLPSVENTEMVYVLNTVDMIPNTYTFGAIMSSTTNGYDAYISCYIGAKSTVTNTIYFEQELTNNTNSYGKYKDTVTFTVTIPEPEEGSEITITSDNVEFYIKVINHAVSRHISTYGLLISDIMLNVGENALPREDYDLKKSTFKKTTGEKVSIKTCSTTGPSMGTYYAGIVSSAPFGKQTSRLSMTSFNNDITYTFRVKSDNPTQYYDTFLLELRSGFMSSCIDLRPDLYGWEWHNEQHPDWHGISGLTYENWVSNINWDYWVETIKHADVTIRIKLVDSGLNIVETIKGVDNHRIFTSSIRITEGNNFKSGILVCLTSGQEANAGCTVIISNIEITTNELNIASANGNILNTFKHTTNNNRLSFSYSPLRRITNSLSSTYVSNYLHVRPSTEYSIGVIDIDTYELSRPSELNNLYEYDENLVLLRTASVSALPSIDESSVIFSSSERTKYIRFQKNTDTAMYVHIVPSENHTNTAVKPIDTKVYRSSCALPLGRRNVSFRDASTELLAMPVDSTEDYSYVDAKGQAWLCDVITCDYKNSTYNITSNVAYVELNEHRTWTRFTTNTFRSSLSIAAEVNADGIYHDCIDSEITKISTTSTGYIYVYTSTIDDVDTFIEWLKEHPIRCVYKRYSPTISAFSDEDVAKIRTLKQYCDRTCVSTESDVKLLVDFTLEPNIYCADLQKQIDDLRTVVESLVTTE